jgi:hypothetical protein
VLACAATGAGRLRSRGGAFAVAGALALGLLVLGATASARDELRVTYDQLYPALLELRQWDRDLPAGRSVRIDVPPSGVQLWAAYMLAGRPVCALDPLRNTSYPHPRPSRRADYVLGDRALGRPAGAIGRPVRANAQFALYRMRAGVPGPENCSREMVQTVTRLD